MGLPGSVLQKQARHLLKFTRAVCDQRQNLNRCPLPGDALALYRARTSFSFGDCTDADLAGLQRAPAYRSQLKLIFDDVHTDVAGQQEADFGRLNRWPPNVPALFKKAPIAPCWQKIWAGKRQSTESASKIGRFAWTQNQGAAWPV